MNKKIRCLKPEEIEIRVQTISEKGVQLLLYKDSRCDKRILDETFGITGWKNRYEEIKGNLFCTISVWDEEKQQWIDKCDCGTESFSEKEKGEASDAFKRAGFNVGIGRELYTRIFYFAKVGTQLSKNGKYEMTNKYEKFTVSEISTNEKTEKIEKIKIVNSENKVVFSYGYKKQPEEQIEIEKHQEEPLPVEKQETKKKNTPVMMDDGQLKAIRILLAKDESLKQKTYKKLEIEHSEEMLVKLNKASATELIKQLKEKLGE